MAQPTIPQTQHTLDVICHHYPSARHYRKNVATCGDPASVMLCEAAKTKAPGTLVDYLRNVAQVCQRVVADLEGGEVDLSTIGTPVPPGGSVLLHDDADRPELHQHPEPTTYVRWQIERLDSAYGLKYAGGLWGLVRYHHDGPVVHQERREVDPPTRATAEKTARRLNAEQRVRLQQ